MGTGGGEPGRSKKGRLNTEGTEKILLRAFGAHFFLRVLRAHRVSHAFFRLLPHSPAPVILSLPSWDFNRVGGGAGGIGGASIERAGADGRLHRLGVAPARRRLPGRVSRRGRLPGRRTQR